MSLIIENPVYHLDNSVAATDRRWEFLAQLRRLLPRDRLATALDEREAAASDRSGIRLPGIPMAIAYPQSVAEVQTLLRTATAYGVPVIPRGSGTGLSGGACASDDSLVISTERLTRILEISPDDEIAVVEPGVITADLDRAVRQYGLMYAPDPASHEISTIGGNIATNAGGLHCTKYGVTRESVLGLTVVLADGTLLRTGRRTIKGVTGFDLTGLFVGSEGTLGIVVEAILRLLPVRSGRPPSPRSSPRRRRRRVVSWPSCGPGCRPACWSSWIPARCRPSTAPSRPTLPSAGPRC